MASLFADASALIKRYIAGTHLDNGDAWFVLQSEITISRLTVVEFCSEAERLIPTLSGIPLRALNAM